MGAIEVPAGGMRMRFHLKSGIQVLGLVIFLASQAACLNRNMKAIGSEGTLNEDRSSSLSKGRSPSNDSPTSDQLLKNSCIGGNTRNLCLAIKYVTFKDATGKSVLSEKDAIQNIIGINQVFSQCNIGFQIEEFISEDPTKTGLLFNTGDDAELDEIRKTFQDPSALLIVTTGKWNRSGTLGKSSANAWTNMPGADHPGVVLESTVAVFSNIIAHELGHYLSLYHIQDQSYLMNPIIYKYSTKFTEAQCNSMRESAQNHWKAMLR
jgi:hypothetical protein